MKVRLNGDDWYKVTSDFGNQNSVHSSDYHTGMDLSMNSGTEIHSPVGGVVEKIVDFGNENIGRGIYIKTEDGNTMILGHLTDSKVEVGEELSKGDLIATSGNTGHSTGAHLHIGVKNEDGNFIDPDLYLTSTNDVAPKTPFDFLLKENEIIISSDGSAILNGEIESKGVVENYKDFADFIGTWKEEGFFHAMYGKSFFGVVKDFFAELFTDIGTFILSNGDLFFLTPAILLMFGTFIIGRNKWAKWILPLWFLYFLSSFFHKMLLV